MSAPSPGWNPDPLGRHEYRYWDGQDWTDDVSDDGVTSVDPVDGPAPFGGEPTAPFDPTQQYTPPGQADPYGAQPGGYAPQPGPSGYGPTAGPAGYGQQAGPGGPGYGDPGGYGAPGGYGSGPMPPGQPPKSGPPVPLIVGGVVVLLAVIVGLVVLLTGGDDDDDPVATDDVTTTTAGDDVTTTTSPDDETTTTAGDDSTTTTEGSSDTTPIDVFSLAAGDCFLDPSADGGVEEVPGVPCSEPHDNEVFYVHVIDAAELPSEDEMATLVEDECHPAFESYVGVDYYSSELYIRTLKPSEESWSSGDRELVCVLYEPDTQMTGSAAGTNR